jgi:hypothetical protein
VYYIHIYFSSNLCHHGSGGAAVDSAPSQEAHIFQIAMISSQLHALLRNYGAVRCG